MTRTQIIADLADDIVDNFKLVPISRYDCIDCLIDSGDIGASIVFGLTHSDVFVQSDAKTDLDELIRKFAINYLTNDPRGQDHIDDLVAEARKDEEAEAEYQRRTYTEAV